MEYISNKFVLYGLENYKETINETIDELKLPHDSDSCFDIRLMLTEAITNAFKHGNESCIDKPIYFRYFSNGFNVRFEIEDSGNGLKDVIMPEQVSEESLLDDCGRGLFLINALADEVRLQDNTIIIKKNFKNSEALRLTKEIDIEMEVVCENES